MLNREKNFTFDSQNQNLAFKMEKQLEKLSQVTKSLKQKQDCTHLSDTGDVIMKVLHNHSHLAFL